MHVCPPTSIQLQLLSTNMTGNGSAPATIDNHLFLGFTIDNHLFLGFTIDNHLFLEFTIDNHLFLGFTIDDHLFLGFTIDNHIATLIPGAHYSYVVDFPNITVFLHCYL